MLEFHVITPQGQVQLFSVDRGRVVLTDPDPGEPLAARRAGTSAITPTRPELENHPAHGVE